VVNFTIKEKVYRVPLIIVIGKYQEYCDYMDKKYKIKETAQSYYRGMSTIYTNNGNAISGIWLPRFNGEPDDVVTLCHEIDHTVQHIMDKMEIPYIPDNNNHAYIYLKEYFLYESLIKLERLKK